jgi:hypothetical protein
MMMNTLTDLPIRHLKRAVNIREQIEALTQELNQLLEASALLPLETERNGKRSGLTPMGRAKIAAAQRLRWSKYNGGRITPAKVTTGKPRLSPAGRAKVAAAVRARWDRFRAMKARALKAK